MTERPDLAPYAAHGSESRGRRHSEPFKDDRPPFERDRDRIIHCAAFRRLEYKTQVFVNHEGDYYRTRLTHSLEVAQISRGIARRLHLNEDLVEALALAHDLGHTPFGHAGEDVLNRKMMNAGGFEHNRQSLRIVEILEERYPDFNGLNLSWETREGIIKHSNREDFSAQGVEEEYAPRERPALEAQIIDPADEIAYNNHDIDDGLKAGYIQLSDLSHVDLWRETWETVAGKFPRIDRERHIYQTISHLIGTLIQDLVEHTLAKLSERGIKSVKEVRCQPENIVSFSPEVAKKNLELKQFLYKYLYRHHKVERMRVKVERILTFLFDIYAENNNLLPLEQQHKFEKYGTRRVICDYIAGMTDRYAFDEYRRLMEPYEPV
ncbi:MAG: deoxyguanosinetriphosphate triphosphohydrolase [Thermodesulfobacteriota bacterium]|jgi:dGTPase|nr:deoxyguanosinetriphosphate triphosphohydrolase [Thermodesulfobacteriota bacterium]